jgi:hypothetical protein
MQPVMCDTAIREFRRLVSLNAGTLEGVSAQIFLSKVRQVPDNPSPRVMALTQSKALGPLDKIIFGTGDKMNMITMTSDADFVSAAAHHGVPLRAVVHKPGHFRHL